jgi:LysM repeat protein
MIRDYLDWAAEQVGIARLIAYLLPIVAVVSLVGGVAAYATKDDGSSGGGGLATAPTAVATRPAAPTVAQPGNLTPLVPQGTPPPANTTPGTPRPPGSPVAGTPGPAGTPPPAGTPGGTPRPAGTPPPATTPAPPAGATYTVVSGDTGFGIANKLNIPAAQQQQWVNDLLRINNTTAGALRVGQVLNLPPPAPGAAPAPGGAAPAATPRP